MMRSSCDSGLLRRRPEEVGFAATDDLRDYGALIVGRLNVAVHDEAQFRFSQMGEPSHFSLALPALENRQLETNVPHAEERIVPLGEYCQVISLNDLSDSGIALPCREVRLDGSMPYAEYRYNSGVPKSAAARSKKPMSEFAQRVEALMEALELKPVDVERRASKAGHVLTANYISKMKSGAVGKKPDYETIMALQAGLGVSFDKLLGQLLPSRDKSDITTAPHHSGRDRSVPDSGQAQTEAALIEQLSDIFYRAGELSDRASTSAVLAEFAYALQALLPGPHSRRHTPKAGGAQAGGPRRDSRAG
jgi:transcriptional regulator with XRE-family HTH domain